MPDERAPDQAETARTPFGRGLLRRKKSPTGGPESAPESVPPSATTRALTIFDVDPVPAGISETQPLAAAAAPPAVVSAPVDPAPAFVPSSAAALEPTLVSPALPTESAAADSVLTPEPEPEKKRREISLPTWMAGRNAALVTGAVVGFAMVLATYLAMQACNLVQGTTSCGRAGFFLLLVILIGAAFLGAALLRSAGVPEAGSTSLLAVGVLAVFTLLFLVGVLFAWWMVVVIPLVGVGAFALSHWVTSTVADASA